MSKVRHQCPKSDTIVQNQTLVSKIGHYCTKSDAVAQNGTQLSKYRSCVQNQNKCPKSNITVQTQILVSKNQTQRSKIRTSIRNQTQRPKSDIRVENRTLSCKIRDYCPKSDTAVQISIGVQNQNQSPKLDTSVQNQTLASKIRHYCRSSLGCVSRCSILQQGRSPIRSSQLSFTSSSKEDRRLGKGLTIFLVHCSCINQMLTFSLLEQSEGLLCCSLSFHPIPVLSSIVREINFFFHSVLASLYYLL